jgi:hypothetical protein
MEATVGRELPADERLSDPAGLVARLVELDESTFNLVLYLVMCHHGKVRATLAMSPRDQDNAGPGGDLPIRGVREEDVLPMLVLVDEQGCEFELPQVTLHLDPARLGLSRRYGPSWVERVLALREHYGSFQLAWLEALLRVADVRASQIASPLDPRLPANFVEVQPMAATEDRDAQLREWIEKTLANAAAQGEGSGPGRRGTAPRTTRSRTTARTTKRGAS